LPAILKGELVPTLPAERLGLAVFCQRYKQLHGTAARFYAAAFAAEPRLAAQLQLQHRYNAACSAALASAGQSADARPLPDKAAGMFRRWALDWLDADLLAYTQLVEQGNVNAKQAVQKWLAHWQKDADLASVRDPFALDRLSEEERAAWKTLWRNVEELRNRAASKDN
jgi:hypothetical protein